MFLEMWKVFQSFWLVCIRCIVFHGFHEVRQRAYMRTIRVMHYVYVDIFFFLLFNAALVTQLAVNGNVVLIAEGLMTLSARLATTRVRTGSGIL